MLRSNIRGTFRAIQDWIILKPIKPKKRERVENGVLIPDRIEDYGPCLVVAAGPGFRHCSKDGVYGPLQPTELKEGDTVWIQKFVEGEMKFALNGEMVYAIRERHVNCKLVNAA